MKRSAHIAAAFLDRIAHADVLMIQCKDRVGSCDVFLDIMEGTTNTGIVGIRGDALKGFPRAGAAMSDVFRWARMGKGRMVYHPSKGWLDKPDLNDFYYLQLRS